MNKFGIVLTILTLITLVLSGCSGESWFWHQKLTTSVIANFKQVIKEGDLRIHPLITRLVDPDTLKKMGAAPVAKPTQEETPAS